MALYRCDTESCAGHLGKFSDCVSEAIWQVTLDGTCESTGSVEFDGFHALVPFMTPDSVKLYDGGPVVTVPAGWYVAREDHAGFVTVDRYDTEEQAREIFDAANTHYCEWLDVNEPHLAEWQDSNG